ncbi:S41 family peptidase [Butyrivibrio sp. CB08]|uniref:S41 family peptidase n=1 Tax=Butyrivibrio sp. CB08 TaxID=2364879 RepID=UPI00131437F8|nr:S41 family peptidase [Butyrivibrio sp. CB08]
MKKRLIVALGLIIPATLLFGCGNNASKEESSFTQKQITVYDTGSTEKSELTCVFKDATPNIPYVSLEQYLDLVYGGDSDYSLTGKGNHFVVTGKNKNTGKTGSKLKVDTKKETLTFEKYEDFVVGKKDETMVDYVDTILVSQKGDPKVTYDLSRYEMDICTQDGQVFLPLSTWSDILDQSLTYADYIDGSIYLIRSGSSSDEAHEMLQKEEAYYDTLTREADVASHAYHELCFSLENLYGRPPRAHSQEFVDSLKAIGLDKTLEKGGTMEGIDLKKMKNYLTSTNKAEFVNGLTMLDCLLFDGGHTFVSSPFLFTLLYNDDSALSNAYRELLNEDPSAKDTVNDLISLWEIGTVKNANLYNQRMEGFGIPSKIWTNEYEEEVASIYLFDNTAIFQFDSFTDDVVRMSSGEKPFLDALKYAKENGCDNFVIDLSINGGGSDQVMGYILTMICGEDVYAYNYDVNTGSRMKRVFHADKNPDGTIDDMDAETKFDFNYAFMISGYTYSSGNYAAVLAKEHGIPMLGETSGGGGCYVNSLVLPDEFNSYQLSSSLTMTDSKYKGVDGGAEPDYPMSVVPGDGSGNPSLYDPKQIVSIVNNHYLSKP